MDLLAVARVLWRFKLLVLPVMLLTFCAAVFVYQFGPRSFESTLSYAVVNPAASVSPEIEEAPAAQGLNNDNPYLRSPDPNLVTSVLITRMRAASVAQALEASGLSTEYTVAPGIGNFIVDITGEGASAEESVRTTTTLGKLLEDELYAMQTINGADSRFLYTALAVAPPEQATERFSSRLRAVIVVLLGGSVLLLSAVSLGRGLESGSQRRKAPHGARRAQSGEVNRRKSLSTKDQRTPAESAQLMESKRNY